MLHILFGGYSHMWNCMKWYMWNAKNCVTFSWYKWSSVPFQLTDFQWQTNPGLESTSISKSSHCWSLSWIIEAPPKSVSIARDILKPEVRDYGWWLLFLCLIKLYIILITFMSSYGLHYTLEGKCMCAWIGLWMWWFGISFHFMNITGNKFNIWFML